MLKTTYRFARSRAAAAAFTAFVALTLPVATPAKTTVVQCVDANGEVTWRSACPPDQSEVARRDVYTGENRDTARVAAKQQAPVLLYTVSACETCDLVRTFLDRIGVPYTEFDLETDVAAQDRLEAQLGRLVAPVTSIGSDVIEGYDRSRIRALAVDAGYPLTDDAGRIGGNSNTPAAE